MRKIKTIKSKFQFRAYELQNKEVVKYHEDKCFNEACLLARKYGSILKTKEEYDEYGSTYMVTIDVYETNP